MDRPPRRQDAKRDERELGWRARLPLLASWRLGGFSLLFVVACGSGGTGMVSEGIVNGTSDSADTSVVAVIVHSANGAVNDVTCSGTVVSPHVVLTAAHCIDTALVGPIDHVSIFLGDNFLDPNELAIASNNVAVASFSADPQFAATSPSVGHDIAVVVAASALLLTPQPLNRSGLGSGDVGAAVHSVGFGQSNGTDPTSAGPRRSIDTTIFELDDVHITLDDVICEGDSGGPTFMTKNGKTVLAGVHSYTDAQNCIGTGEDTRVDVSTSSFIDPAIDKADPGFLPSGCSSSGGRGDPWAFLIALVALARRRSK